MGVSWPPVPWEREGPRVLVAVAPWPLCWRHGVPRPRRRPQTAASTPCIKRLNSDTELSHRLAPYDWETGSPTCLFARRWLPFPPAPAGQGSSKLTGRQPQFRLLDTVSAWRRHRLLLSLQYQQLLLVRWPTAIWGFAILCNVHTAPVAHVLTLSEQAHLCEPGANLLDKVPAGRLAAFSSSRCTSSLTGCRWGVPHGGHALLPRHSVARLAPVAPHWQAGVAAGAGGGAWSCVRV